MQWPTTVPGLCTMHPCMLDEGLHGSSCLKFRRKAVFHSAIPKYIAKTYGRWTLGTEAFPRSILSVTSTPENMFVPVDVRIDTKQHEQPNLSLQACVAHALIFESLQLCRVLSEKPRLAQTWKQPWCPSADDKLYLLSYIHTMNSLKGMNCSDMQQCE